MVNPFTREQQTVACTFRLPGSLPELGARFPPFNVTRPLTTHVPDAVLQPNMVAPTGLETGGRAIMSRQL